MKNLIFRVVGTSKWQLPVQLDTYEEHLAVQIADRSNDEGFCWWSVKVLAGDKMTVRTAHQKLKNMAKKGLIRIFPRFGLENGRQMGNVFLPVGWMTEAEIKSALGALRERDGIVGDGRVVEDSTTVPPPPTVARYPIDPLSVIDPGNLQDLATLDLGATWPDADAPDLDEARVTVLEEQAATTEVVAVGDLVPVQQVMLETTSVGAEIAVVEDPAIEVGRKAWRELFSDKKLTPGQRTDRLAKVYIGALRGRKTAFHSVRAVVKVSVDAGRSDQEIAAALVRLAERPDRILSVNVLETEILTGGQQTFVSKGTQGLMAAMAWAAKYEGTGE